MDFRIYIYALLNKRCVQSNPTKRVPMISYNVYKHSIFVMFIHFYYKHIYEYIRAILGNHKKMIISNCIYTVYFY